ncbi:NHL repeat-containing protein [Candidatus Parabeggiatoa sp. HSG14]|uniref:NHL repeat-containing protein n=1 Tax=Candidatus Parabeggiatoa sp. HSG14 TaxID=3055593 RepID=UPI0025A8D6F6|nr:NHL repeat-containing protein [Thiotrichales bacterium HSG14]
MNRNLGRKNHYLNTLWVFAILLLGFLPYARAEYFIDTVAGDGESGYDGDGKFAIYAKMLRPYGVALDSQDNVYIADTNNRRIRKIDSNGIITTIAGNDDKATTRLHGPYGIVVDSQGNVYFSDFLAHRVYKINAKGIITVIAGDDTGEYSGDNGLATGAQLNEPRGIAFDSKGNLYIADAGNHRIRMIDTDGIITTVAGDGTTIQSSSIGGPIFSGAYGGDEGLATAAQLDSPSGIAIDKQGDLYITDTNNNRIRKVDTDGIITTVASDELNQPIGIVIDNESNIYVADSKNHLIRKIDTDGVMTTIAGSGAQGYSGDEKAGIAAKLYSPKGIALDSTGRLYVADSENNRIRQLRWITELPNLGKNHALDLLSKRIEGVETKFWGGISVNGDEYLSEVVQNRADTVDVLAKISVDKKHADGHTRADTLVVVGYTPPVGEQVFLMLRVADVDGCPPKSCEIDIDNPKECDSSNIPPTIGTYCVYEWNQNIGDLVSFQEYLRLESEQWIQLYAGQLPVGAIQFYFGYRLRNGILVYNRNIIDVTINE